MSQAVPDLANQLSASLRTNLNLSLKALNSNNSGATEPTYSYSNMFWMHTLTGDSELDTIFKVKPQDNAAGQWISIGYLNQSTDEFSLFDDTKVVNTSGTQTGLIGDQAESVWEAGTSTTESLVSPAKVKAAILANTSGIQKYIGTPLSSWSVNANYAFAHNLGTTPSNVTVCLTAKTANNGFSSGDVIMPGSGYRYSGWGIFINKVTTSSVQLRVNGSGIRWDNPSTGAQFTIQDSTNWSLSCNVIG